MGPPARGSAMTNYKKLVTGPQLAFFRKRKGILKSWFSITWSDGHVGASVSLSESLMSKEISQNGDIVLFFSLDWTIWVLESDPRPWYLPLLLRHFLLLWTMPIQGQLFLDTNICRGAARASVHYSTSIIGGFTLQLVGYRAKKCGSEATKTWLRNECTTLGLDFMNWQTLHEIVKGAGTRLLQHSYIKLKFTLQNPQEDETKLLQILFPITITMAFHKIETCEGEL